MKQKDNTYDLIRSLTKSEKRSFSLQSALTVGSKNYMKVFEALEKQKEYNNEALVKLAKKWKINLSYEKAYLQKQIIKMLRNVHFEGSHEMTVNQLILDIDLLLTKKVYPLVEEQLNKAKRIAENAELFPQLLTLQKWEYRLAIRKGDRVYQEEYTRKQLPLEKAYLEAYKNLLEYKGLQSHMLGIIHKVGVVYDEEKSKEIRKIISDPLLKDEKHALSFIARSLFYEIKGVCHTQLNDYRKAYESNRAMVLLFEKNPGKSEANPQGYFAALSNLSTRCILLEKYDESEHCALKMEELLSTKSAKENQNLGLEIQTLVYERRMLASCFSGQYDKAQLLSKNMEQFISEHQRVLRKNFIAFHNLFSACAYFESGRFRESLRHTRSLLKEQKEQVRVDYMISAHFLYFTLLFEMDDQEHLYHLIKTSKRFLETSGASFKCIPVITACFLQLATGKKNAGSKEKLLSETLRELIVLYKVPSEKMILENFNIIRWMEEKVRSF